MKFSEIEYVRPNMDEVKADFTALIDGFKVAGSAEEQQQIIDKINALRSEFETATQVAMVRNSIDTNDKFYDAERAFINTAGPVYQSMVTEYYKALASSKFKAELEAKYGKHLFNLAEVSVKSFNDTIIELSGKENELASEYSKLVAQAKVEFQGTTTNLAGLSPFMQSSDREVRKAAAKAYYGYFEANVDEFDRIYDALVKTRAEIADKLGFNNFVELGYVRMNRTDYSAADVAKFRDQVVKYVVPLASKLHQRQQDRLGLSEMKFYDNGFNFNSGNAKPKGNPDWILNHGKEMYNELSDETKEFFDFMTSNELLDLVNKEGKMAGGYCTFFQKYGAPFIFSNFNGTSHDIDVLTHEAGHAFQIYNSKHFAVPEYFFPTYEACEIHSMSMEFFTWPWMERFFEDDTTKYKFMHVASSISRLTYITAVDEFQHFVYENPNVTPAERRAAYREIEQKYMPWIDYDGNEYLQSGGAWQKQLHIYQMPFYYIDYALAQICAFQFWVKMLDNRETAWNDYLQLCKQGGSQPFLELVKFANLKSPFESSTLEGIIEKIEAYLNQVDDKAL